jgi:hypothetical protein
VAACFAWKLPRRSKDQENYASEGGRDDDAFVGGANKGKGTTMDPSSAETAKAPMRSFQDNRESDVDLLRNVGILDVRRPLSAGLRWEAVEAFEDIAIENASPARRGVALDPRAA